jgi:hypothetical protein
MGLILGLGLILVLTFAPRLVSSVSRKLLGVLSSLFECSEAEATICQRTNWTDERSEAARRVRDREGPNLFRAIA